MQFIAIKILTACLDMTDTVKKQCHFDELAIGGAWSEEKTFTPCNDRPAGRTSFLFAPPHILFSSSK
jgi:hypothetical protein